MKISVINLTNGLIPDQEVITAIRAINRQIREDFSPYWNLQGQLQLEGTSVSEPDVDAPVDLRGQGIIYLWDDADVQDALGYHEANFRGIPYGFVFVEIATELGESWTVTLSHEVLELLGDPQANKLIRGPDPRDPANQVFHWHEMCDAVQGETYEIDGVEVSNFVLPLYFTEDSEPGSRNDFLGSTFRDKRKHLIGPLQSFGINPGGYIGFYDPVTNEYVTQMSEIDLPAKSHGIAHASSARARRNIKNKARMARRGNRYTQMGKDTAEEALKLARNKDLKLSVNRRKLNIRSNNSSLLINHKIDPLRATKQQGRGYFAHNIIADADSLDTHLKEVGFKEIAAVEISATTNRHNKTSARAELDIAQSKTENLVALVDVDGVLFLHLPEKTRYGKASFNIPLPAGEQITTGRRAMKFRPGKAIVRVISQKISATFKKLMKENLASFLAELVEKKGFRKPESARLFEMKLLPKPNNHTIGELHEFSGKLQTRKRYLILVHGIFSSVDGAFSELLRSRNEDFLLAELQQNYDHIIGFDHWTVAKSTLENAQELLERLPDDCHLDLLCHSRGAGVVRCLLEHPELAPQLLGRQIRVGKAIFVAGACQGSDLALPERVGTLVNVFSALSSTNTAFIPSRLLLGVFKALQYGVTHFPGIAAMSPDSEILAALNQPLDQPGCEYIYSRSDFEPKGLMLNLLDQAGLDKFVFQGKKNDGVVPFEGAGTFDEHVQATAIIRKGPGFDKNSSPQVFHTQFFKQPGVRNMLLEHLSKPS